jgi:hypothetical protein
MARTASPYTAILKRMKRLHIKAEKLNTEIKLFASFIEAQAKQSATTAKKKPTAKTAKTVKKGPRAKVVKKAPTKRGKKQ